MRCLWATEHEVTQDEAPFKPVEATIGGLLIGIAAGIYMLLAQRVAGNSGVLKAFIVGPRDSKVAYLLGLAIAGVAMYHSEPQLFDQSTRPTNTRFAWGVVMGIGTYLGNGCTSGHGLCGISRMSVRSFVAVPIFMITAVVSSSIETSIRTGKLGFGAPAPAQVIDHRTLVVSLSAIAVLLLTLVPTVALHYRTAKGSRQTVVVGMWCGLCAGVGLSIGGMVRPSCVQAALAPHRVDFTLWLLFMVALATTFVFYRVASRYGNVAEACARPSKLRDVDHKLVLGAALFGASWGATGFCPGPLLVTLGAQPSSINVLLTLMGNVVGVLLADSSELKALHHSIHSRLTKKRSEVSPRNNSETMTPPEQGQRPTPSPPASPSPAASPSGAAVVAPSVELDLATTAELSAALDAGAIVIDVRPAVATEAVDGVFSTITGARSILWDGPREMHPGALETISTSTPLVVICRSGRRASRAAAFLRASGYGEVLNGGGPMAADDSGWVTLMAKRGAVSYELAGLQQFVSTEGSNTCTYILVDAPSKEALIIDSVVEVRARAHAISRACHLARACNLQSHST